MQCRNVKLANKNEGMCGIVYSCHTGAAVEVHYRLSQARVVIQPPNSDRECLPITLEDIHPPKSRTNFESRVQPRPKAPGYLPRDQDKTSRAKEAAPTSTRSAIILKRL
jgi:hypothetical protein